MKKAVTAFLLLVLALSVTGCMRLYGSYTVNSDGTITSTTKESINKEFADQMGSVPEDSVLETLEDGQQYYTVTETKTGTANEMFEDSDVIMTGDIFYYAISGETDETVNSGHDLSEAINKSIYVKLSVTLLSDIVDTNANVTAETSGQTACFDTSFTGASWYAYTAHGKELIAADVTAPSINNITDGGYYRSVPDVTFSDDICIASKTLNGKPYSILNVVDGMNTITATDIKGNISTVTFYIDGRPPVIKGVKNGKNYTGKTYFYVKDKLSLASVTVNGKKQKLSKNKLVKKGRYKDYYKLTLKKKGKNTIVAKDSAGNRIKFRINIR